LPWKPWGPAGIVRRSQLAKFLSLYFTSFQRLPTIVFGFFTLNSARFVFFRIAGFAIPLIAKGLCAALGTALLIRPSCPKNFAARRPGTFPNTKNLDAFERGEQWRVSDFKFSVWPGPHRNQIS